MAIVSAPPSMECPEMPRIAPILELGPSDNPTIGGGKGNLAGGKLILSPCQMRQMPIKQFDGSFLDHCSPISPPQALYVFSLWVKTMTQSQTKAAK